MNTIQLRLSNKTDKNGRQEVLFKVSMRVKAKVATLRGKSGISVQSNHFQYYIDRKSCQELGVKVPVKMITVTKDEAIKKGIAIFDKGEVIISDRVMTPAVIEDKLSADKLSSLVKVVSEAINDKVCPVMSSETLQKIIDKFHHPEAHITVDELEDKMNIYELMELYLSKKQFPIDGEKGFRVLIRTLWRYEAYRQLTDDKSFTLDIDTMTKYDVEDFEDYMRNEYDLSEEYPKIFAKIVDKYPDYIVANRKSRKLERRGENCIIKLKKKLKAFFAWLYETDRTTNRPFEGVKIGSEKYGTPYYISVKERNKIADTDLSDTPSLETQRDIFVFQCLIGCRVGDLIKLTQANITNGILQYIPHKTKDGFQQVKARIPLTDKALSLIEKYQGKDKYGRLFPFISPQKYNVAIKKVFAVCGITRNVSVRNPKTGETEIRPINEVASSHMARRTFVGSAYKVVKDPNLIGKMSGHVEGSKAFARYRDIDDDMLKEVISQIE